MVDYKEGDYYKMNHPKRGIAVIFNHEKFLVPNLTMRKGSQVDCNDLIICWENLGFTVKVHNDYGIRELMEELESLSKINYSEMDCLVICVLSHGTKEGIYAKDAVYEREKLWKNFTADNCPTLGGKPKLFFIQACQGNNLDPGITLSQVDGILSSYRIPIHPDFLIDCSTIPGFYAWRKARGGSWFIQALCEELRKNFLHYDLLNILTFVNRRVATDFESYDPDNIVGNKMKQIPCIISMLTRLCKFSSPQNTESILQ